MIKKHSKAVFYCVGTQVLKKDFRKKKRKGGKLDFPWVGPYLITRSLGKGFYELQSCGKGPVTTIPRVSHVHIKVYKSLFCSPSRRLQPPSASNESHSNSPALGASPSRSAVSLSPTKDETTLGASPSRSAVSLYPTKDETTLGASPSRSAVSLYPTKDETTLGASPSRSAVSLSPTKDETTLGASPSRSAVTLSPAKDETTFALSPTAKDLASAVLQESNHTSKLQYPSLLSEKPKLLTPTPEFFPKGDGTRSKLECNTKTKLVAKLMRQNSKKMTVPCRPAIEVESYVPLAQNEVQHWVPGLTTEDKKMIKSGGWLSDEIVDAGQKLLKSMYPHIQGLQEVALGMVLSYSIAKSEFIQIMNTGKHHWVTVSNINCNYEEIRVYDCASGGPTSSLLNQIASIICTPKDIIKLTYMDVQMQQGCDDCGLFAIAFATSLARGEQPGSFFYEQKAMRKHLIESLEKQTITAFPIQKIRRHGSKVRHSSNVPIHCVCRLPKLEGIKMIECSYCGTWYHIDLCVSVSSDSQQPHTKWACVKCKSWTEN